MVGGGEEEGEECGKWRYILPITGRIYGIPFMLSFRERSQVTIPGLRRSRNEISFASPRGARFRTSARADLFPLGASSSFPAASPPVGEPPWRGRHLRSLPIFSSFREKRREVRHQGVYRKDLVVGRYYSSPPLPFAKGEPFIKGFRATSSLRHATLFLFPPLLND